MHSRPRITRSSALVAATATAVLFSFAQPTAAEPAAPAPTPAPTPVPTQVEPAPAPSAEPEPAPSTEEQPAAPTTPPPAEASVLQAPAAVETNDGAISDLVTVEQTEAPAALARMSSAEVDPIIEQTDVKPFRMAGVNWTPDPALTDIQVKVRVRVGGAWGEWQDLPIADETEVESSTDPLWTESADGIAVQATSAQGPLPDVKITTIDPGPETVDTPAVYTKSMAAETVETATVSRPPIITRAGWGAGSGTSCDATRGTMQGIVIHHTAGANNYSRGESAAIVRAYQTDHIVRQGWCDIGYNFLVDKYGQIFEGRANSINRHVRGAHAGVGSVNDNTTGISMMGNFETADIRSGEWATLRNTTVRLVAWRLQQYGLTALSRVTLNGSTHFRVSGHRNWKATACPGRYGIAWLDAPNGLRYEVDQLMFYSGGGTPPATEKPVVRGLQTHTVQSEAVGLQWSAFKGAAKYRLYFSTSSARPQTCSTGDCYDVAGNQLSRTFTGLTPGGTYYARIVAMDSSGRALSEWHETPLTIKTMPVVRGLTPERVEADRFSVRWSATSGAAKYRLYVSTDRSRPETCSTGHCYDVAADQLNRVFTDLKPNTTYYARIVAMNAAGQGITDWHAAPLTIKTQPVISTLRAEGLQSDRMTLRWNAVAGAARYRLFVSTSSDYPMSCGTSCHDVSGTTLSHTMKGLRSGATYYARVVAMDSSGKALTGWQAAPVTVRTPTTTAALVQGLRTEEVVADQATFRWNSVTGASRYRLHVSTSPEAPTSCSGACYDTKGSELNRVVKDLTPGTSYYARVVAMDAKGTGITEWQSAPVTVRTPPLVRGLTATDVRPDRVALRWSPFEGAARYRLHISTSPDRPTRCGDDCHDVAGDQRATEINGLKPGTRYYVRVVAMNSGGLGISDWHPTALRIDTPAAAPVVQGLRAENALADRATFRWNAVSGAARYRLHVSTSSAKPTSCGDSCFDTKGTELNRVVSGLDYNTTYYARVVAMDAQGRGISEWSDAAVAVKTMPLIRGLSASGVQADRATLSWNAFSGAARYRLHVSTSPDRPSTCGTSCYDVDGNQTSRAFTGLRANTTYYARVVAMNSAGTGITDWHPTALKFTTRESASNATNVGYVRNGSLTVKGHGYGHGIGMSQFGALGGARAGRSYREILGHYYSGTSIGTHWTNIRVHITAATSPDLTILARGDITFRNAAGRSERLPTAVSGRGVERWRITRVSGDAASSKLQYLHRGTWYNHGVGWRGNGEFNVPGGAANTLILPNGSQVRYRGILRSAVPSQGSTQRVTVNVVALEDYVRGVVPREMPSSWPQEAVKAQALAARSYAVSTMRPSHYFDVCDTTACQVYGGVNAEQSGSNQAIEATAGQIVTHNGRAAFTQFSSSSGGFTNQTANVSAHPYLRAVNDPWDDTPGNNNHSWTQEVPASRIQSAYPQIGTLEKVRITRRSGNGSMGGRAWDIYLDGSRSSVRISGNAARSVFAMKSDWFGF